MNERSLLPCPFCGSTSVVYSIAFRNVRCNSCMCRTEPGHIDKATAEWNRRSAPAPAKQEQAEAEEVVEELFREANTIEKQSGYAHQHKEQIIYVIRKAAALLTRQSEAQEKGEGELAEVLREYDEITNKADQDDYEWDFVMRAADYRVIRSFITQIIKAQKNKKTGNLISVMNRQADLLDQAGHDISAKIMREGAVALSVKKE